MNGLVQRLLATARRTSFAQAVRLIEHAARGDGTRPARRVGGDLRIEDEPVAFATSERMVTVADDIASVRVEEGQGDRLALEVNVLGLAGATPALPVYYSELQLQRRLLQDSSMVDFLNLINHRALSFFYRVFAKYRWPVGYERERGRDGVTGMLLALGGLGTAGLRDRADRADAVLAPLAAILGDQRRSATQIATALRWVTGLSCRVVAEARWVALPPAERTRIGGPAVRRHARLGRARARPRDESVDGAQEDGVDGADGSAVLGHAVLDVQHHVLLEIGPLPYAVFRRFFAAGGPREEVADLVTLLLGLAYRVRLRLLIEAAQVPQLALGGGHAPSLLGQTTWLGSHRSADVVLDDCIVPLTPTGMRADVSWQ